MIDAPKPTLEPDVKVVESEAICTYLCSILGVSFGWNVGFRTIYLYNVLVRISVFTSQVQIGLKSGWTL